MFRSTALCTLALAAATIAGSTSANAGVRAGLLECRGVDSHTFIIGSVTRLHCVFQPSVGRPEVYEASIHRLGIDLGFTTSSQVNWLVFAPTYRVGPGDLAGGYGGVSASATLGVGVGANALVGGWGNSFTLQPVSLQGQTGLSVAGGIAGMDLVASPAARPHRWHRHHRRHRRHHR